MVENSAQTGFRLSPISFHARFSSSVNGRSKRKRKEAEGGEGRGGEGRGGVH
jgi:hypothetical protein